MSWFISSCYFSQVTSQTIAQTFYHQHIHAKLALKVMRFKKLILLSASV